MKKQLKPIERGFGQFRDAMKGTLKAQKKLEQALLDYKTSLDALAAQTSGAEMMLDKSLPEAADGQQALLDATKQMQETQMSFNMQYLQLQSQMQHENRSYTAISNIMKAKHDTVKNSISNVR
jgi:septal ring factor EnvC (AmiA/AmiB activator)